MKRFLLLISIVLVGATVAAERFPRLHALVPWLPGIPGLASAPSASDTASDGSDAADAKANRRRRFAADGPIPVLTGPVGTADVPVTAEVLGTVQATNSVTVKSQVDGKLVEIDFKEGQDVRAGDVMARIDPATYKALYDSAVAKKSQDEAQLNNAQVDLVRYQKLAETQYGSHQQADTQKALVAQYTAQLGQDQAAIDNAKATLDYATIRSPIDGRTGIRIVDQGNIVHASDTAGIVTVAEIKPIAAIFNLPQQWLRQVNAAQAKGSLKLEARDGDTGAIIDTGTLQVIDNTVDQTTGTVKMKGSFPNRSGQLWPGQFVNLRLYVDTLHDAVVVPTPAVQRGPDGAFVYVVKDGKTAMTKVTTGRQTESETVLTGGLAPPAEVVTTGFTRLNDGAKVSVTKAAAANDPPRSPEMDASDRGPNDGEPDTVARPDAASPAHDDGAKRPRRRRSREGAQSGATN